MYENETKKEGMREILKCKGLSLQARTLHSHVKPITTFDKQMSFRYDRSDTLAKYQLRRFYNLQIKRMKI
jgi:phenylalanyl-tRNA synthetase alpha subunit